ncbi:glycoside hydrolase family 28 protein [Luteolibacter sp. LG18]|uniref:glycoside hydrolase family 28 protein n=1 Tax=Luteolibacter sp. LG18 TaxID=2819286 RepID=UPI0030C6BFE9
MEPGTSNARGWIGWRIFSKGLLALAVVAGSVTSGFADTALSSDPEAAKAWAEVPKILARIVPPVFPKRDFVITTYGAEEGGKADCTKAFAAAIAECHGAGGGRVVVPKGQFLSGPIHLRSKVELHLSEGSEVIFSDRFEDYLPVVPVRVGGIDLLNYSPLVYARDCQDVAVTGKGRLNGNAGKWWAWKGKEGSGHIKMSADGVPVEKRVFGTPEAGIRPNFLVLLNCRNVLLEDFTIGSGPNWTIHPVYSENITIRRVTVDTDGPNNDGVDPDSCRDVLIEHCVFGTGDDCVVLKSGYNEDGWRVARPTENVIMRHCSSKHGHGGLVIGSEMSGDVRNVFMHDCEFEGTDRAIRIKSRSGRGGVVEKIYARDIKVKDMKEEFIILNMDYSADKNAAASDKLPVFRDMCFERITGEGAPVAIRLSGEAGSPLRNIRFRDLRLSATEGVVGKNATGLLFENVGITAAKGPLFNLTDASDIHLKGIATEGTPEIFLDLKGAGSTGIRIEASPAAVGPIKLADEVQGTPVSVE